MLRYVELWGVLLAGALNGGMNAISPALSPSSKSSRVKEVVYAEFFFASLDNIEGELFCPSCFYCNNVVFKFVFHMHVSIFPRNMNIGLKFGQDILFFNQKVLERCNDDATNFQVKTWLTQTGP